MKKHEKKHKVNKWIYWIPRIASIVFILFLAMFSLDVFGNGYGFWGTLLALFMHNLPSLVLTALLIVAWRYEIVGGIAFVLAGLLYILFVLFAVQDDLPWYTGLSWSMIIAMPAFAIGALWLVCWFRKKR
ncbi:hypothetical protein KY359_06630 [Candidatus Woesearchaeota archaeon]|nr:hypothetical protein [Candidatus Woesearchaeota archaeon]